jgi:uncharacterized protein YegP (UPF0339 family)
VAGRFEIYKVAKDDYRFRFRAGNGLIVATGGSYPTKAEAKQAVERVMHAADGSGAGHHEKRRSPNAHQRR